MAPLTRPAHTGLRVVRSTGPDTFPEGAAWREPDAALLSIGPSLCRLLGREGFRALLERALHVAGEDYPFLRTVRPAIAPAGRLVGLTPTRGRSHSEHVADALAATLTALLALMVEFLGSELAEQILYDSTATAPSTISTIRELSHGATA